MEIRNGGFAMSGRVLFLHGGPGLHAGVERRWFHESMPVCWWDQPLPKEDDGSPFRTVVLAATRKLSELCEEAGDPVQVIAHSFGGLVARELARESPGLIGSLTLLAPTRNVYSALQRLMVRLPGWSTTLPSAAVAGRPLAPDPSREQFGEFVQQLLTVSDLFDYYWGAESGGARDLYKQMSGDLPQLHLESFLAVAYDSLRASNAPFAAPCKVPVRIVAGRQDPLFDERDTFLWQAEFPDTELVWLDCGHWVQFEVLPRNWMPNGES